MLNYYAVVGIPVIVKGGLELGLADVGIYRNFFRCYNYNYKTKITKTRKYIKLNNLIYLLSMSGMGTKTIVSM